MRLWSFLRSLFRRRPPPPVATVAPAALQPEPQGEAQLEAQVEPQLAPEAAPQAEPQPAPQVEPETAPASPVPPVVAIAAEPAVVPLEAQDEVLLDEEDEDEWAEAWEDEEEFDDEPDPFICGAEPEVELSAAEVAELRTLARAEALSGEHRLPLSTAVGPGSLAEALNALVKEGRVEAEFVDDPQDGPFMLYRPVAPEA